MKRFDYFGDYMFDLLFAPLKRGKRAVNQFHIFFKVIGREFDDIKEVFFRVRDEANVISASPVMLSVYGQDRDMPRLPEEDTESYRTRLSMKALIARMAGTREGILLGLAALGYRSCDIKPLVYRDPERWAEFLVQIHCSLDDSMPVSSMIKKVVRELKPGSAKDNYGIDFSTTQEVKIVYSNQIIFSAVFYPQFNLPELLLDGSWDLDGSKTLDGYDGDGRIDLYPVEMGFQVKVNEVLLEKTGIIFLLESSHEMASEQEIKIQASVVHHGASKESITIQTEAEVNVGTGEILMENQNFLDGIWELDGSRELNGGSYQW